MEIPDITPSTNQNSPTLSRRRLLQTVGSLLAVSALPLQRLGAAQEEDAATSKTPIDDSVINPLSAYMSAAGGREISPEATEKAKHHILDTFTAMISGGDLRPGRVALKYATAYARTNGEKDVGTIVGSKLLCDPVTAAYVNGTLAHSDETDDSHAAAHTHPGCAMVPAALAASEHAGVSGVHYIRAVVLGYDIGTRFTMAMGGLKYQMATSHSAHSIANNFGAAAAAGCAMSLNPQQMRWLIDYAAQQAGGSSAWMRDVDHISKAIVFGGRPARNGVNSALMLELGATGVNNILSGDDNFFAAMAPKTDPTKLLTKLGERYEVTQTNIKKWTVGSPIQAPLDAIEIIRTRRPFEASDVKSVAVRVAASDAKTVNNRTIANICMQQMVAVMLVDKTVTFKSSHDNARLNDPVVMKERAKVTLIPDEELEKLYLQRQGIVTITFNDGTTETERVRAVSGTSDNPMNRAQVARKSTDLLIPCLGADQTARLIAAIWDLDNLKDIRMLRPLLQRA
jgi:2-methylcitrate dehydratase PrpD